MYVLDARLQDSGGGGFSKWDPRARLGIYLGHSPSNVCSVALVFNPRTGLVSWKELVDNKREERSQQMGSMISQRHSLKWTPSPAHAPPSTGPDVPASQDDGPVIVGMDAAAGEADTDNVSSIPVHNLTWSPMAIPWMNLPLRTQMNMLTLRRAHRCHQC